MSPGRNSGQALSFCRDTNTSAATDMTRNTTASGEHGVGLGKRSFMGAEHGGAYALMRRLKTAVDPDDIMNPGKLV